MDNMDEKALQVNQIEKAVSLTENAMEQASQRFDQVVSLTENAMGLASKYVEFREKNAMYMAEIRKAELFTEVKCLQIAKSYQLAHKILNKVFGERAGALNKIYEKLDDALKTDDREIVIECLRGISSIVEKNPLENFEQFTQALTNKDKTLELPF